MSKLRHAVYWPLALLVIAIILVSVLSRFFSIIGFTEALQERVMGWGAWGAICYPVFFALCNILLLPGGVLAVGGGFFFGLWWGFFIVVVGNFVATGFSFALSRWVATRWFRRRFFSQDTAVRALEPAVQREGWKIIFLSQLHPLFPTSLLNYIYGLTRVRLGTYMLWASIGRMPGLFLYVYAGTLGQLGIRIMRGKSYPRVVEYWIWGGAFVTSALLLAILGRIARRAIQASHALGVGVGERSLPKECISEP